MTAGWSSAPEPFLSLRNQGLIVARSYKDRHGKYIAPAEVAEIDGAVPTTPRQARSCLQVEKMSKSKLNGVPPDELVDEYGVDSVPSGRHVHRAPWKRRRYGTTTLLTGCRRFLSRAYEMVSSEKVTEQIDQALKLGSSPCERCREGH